VDPIVTIVRIGDVARPIGSYGLMMVLSILVGTSLAVRAAARARLDVGLVIATLGYTCTAAGAGAFGLFVAIEWIRTGSPLGALSEPGLVFFGAPLLGGVALYFSTRAFRLPFGVLLDLGVPAIASAHAVGRLGCFLGGCCYGAPFSGPWAVTYTHPFAPAAHPAIPRHPTPLYESGALLVIALVFALAPPSKVGAGRRLLLYGLLYGALRFTVELFRGDDVRGVFFDGALSSSQLIALGVFFGALIALAFRRPLPAGPRTA
jgi:phosphatidylglycerol:prolipoprotein diacylglycerol transferase